MDIYKILPLPDGSWKAVLVGEGELVVSNADKHQLIKTMKAWTAKTGEPMTIRVYNAEGMIESEELITGGD